MASRLATASIAALILLSGCSNDGSGGDAASAQVEGVDPEALRAAVQDERVRRFYEARQWQAVWSEPQAQALTAALDDAQRHALDKADFLPEAAQQAPAEREAAMTLAAIRYADALARGRTDPNEIFEVYTHERPEADPVAGLTRAIEQAQVREWLASLAPQDAEYRAMSEAYLQYRQRAAGEESAGIGAGDAIEPGDSDPRVPAIVAALRTNGYLPAEQPAPQQEGQPQAQPKAAEPQTRYTDAIAAGIRRLQEDYGIEPDGIIGESTLAALNTGAFERARALAVNLERRRWLTRTPSATRIDVNIAPAELSFWRDGQLANRRVVVVGQPGNETPELASPMYRLVANPTWTVPRSIQEEEIEPLGSGYMARNNMEWRDGWIVQRSGPTNALGLVKFDMKNDHAIYLHDTPAKPLFEEAQRHFSHGCVRVHDALGFAQMIAQQEGVLDQWQRARATGEETFVPLPREIPVRLLYHTVYADNGRIVFRPDPYRWDDRVAAALGLAQRDRPQLQSHYRDVGP